MAARKCEKCLKNYSYEYIVILELIGSLKVELLKLYVVNDCSPHYFAKYNNIIILQFLKAYSVLLYLPCHYK